MDNEWSFSIDKNKKNKTKVLIYVWFSIRLAYLKLSLKMNGDNVSNLSIEQWKIKSWSSIFPVSGNCNIKVFDVFIK